MTVGLAICGDPRRTALATALFDIYATYGDLEQVRLLFRRNPAVAFNEAARDMDVDTFVGVAGDVYVGEAELYRFVDLPGTVVSAASPLTPRRNDVIPYPDPWSRADGSFISGLFRVPRSLLLLHPFPEDPSFVEDSLWAPVIRGRGYVTESVNVPCVHIDAHPLIRKRTLKYLLFQAVRRRSLRYLLKMLAWEFQDVPQAILPRRTVDRSRGYRSRGSP